MKIMFVYKVDVDMEKPNLQEIWPKYIHKNTVFNVESIESVNDKYANIILNNNDVLLEVPANSFKILK